MMYVNTRAEGRSRLKHLMHTRPQGDYQQRSTDLAKSSPQPLSTVVLRFPDLSPVDRMTDDGTDSQMKW